MSREKNQKSELRSQNKEDPKVVGASKENLMSFDLYFQKLMSTNSKVLPHHKAAMKKYAEQKGFIEAEEKDFDDIFRVY